MKKITFLLLFVMGCAKNSSENKATNPVTTEIQSAEFHAQQTLVIQGTQIIVKTFKAKYENSKEATVVQIQSETQTLKYAFRTEGGNTPSLSKLSAIENKELSKPFMNDSTPINLKVDEYIETYKTLNHLQLDRCRTSTTWTGILSILKNSRTKVYLSLGDSNTPYALVWNTQTKSFDGIIETSKSQSPRNSFGLKDQTPLIVPNANVRDQNNLLFKDSVYLDFAKFNEECGWHYKYVFGNEIEGKFQPRYKEYIDVEQSQFITVNVEDSTYLPQSIYGSLKRTLSTFDIEYAKNLNFY